MFCNNHEKIGIIDYKVGDVVKERMQLGIVAFRDNHPLEGEIVYVHPLGRFYTVEFDFGGTKVKESYTVRSSINPIIICR